MEVRETSEREFWLTGLWESVMKALGKTYGRMDRESENKLC